MRDKNSTWKRIAGVVVLCLGLTSCRLPNLLSHRSSQPKKKSMVEVAKVDDVDLAKSLLKRKPVPIQVPRDPFQPLAYKQEPKQRPWLSALKEIEFIGLVKTDERISALVKTSQARRVFTIGEEIMTGIVVEEIRSDRLVVRLPDGTLHEITRRTP